ncbi:ABC transporter permease [Polyangium sp. y55x31]|uniref:ABC transporter permease n=1 Tax=Polyangium sp. y55x31 TaxID=3042688 RepID=UPI0024823E89|nr:ABC transporter permease [Polyangium sp. y55x31]MDI1484610.1 ABC transporter permease [Polyangium sp. y55x31]
MDDKLDLGQAYAPPAASPPAAPLPGVGSPYDRIVRWSFPVGVVVGLVLGCVVYLQSVYALSQLNVEKHAPGIVCVAVLRAIGPVSAVLAVSLTAAVRLHRAGRRASGPLEVEHARVLLVLATFPLLTVVTTLFGLLGALLLWLAEPTGTTSEFWASLSDFVRWPDPVYGLAVAAGCGGFLTCLLRIGANWLTTKKHGLALKLFVAYASLAIPNAVLRAVLSVVDPV